MAADSRDLSAVLAFAREASALLSTALSAARDAGAAGQPLTRPAEAVTGGEQHLHWLRVKPEHADRQPLVAGLRDATRHLADARPALDRARAAPPPVSVARLAAARTAVNELRDARWATGPASAPRPPPPFPRTPPYGGTPQRTGRDGDPSP